jgi:drug/metabolite transporter (DMT)-like permease
MNQHLFGVLVALAAAALYSIAVGLQAVEARRAPAEDTLRFALLGRLIRRPLWLAGAATGILGWVLQAVALSFAPLTLVEPTLAASLVFLLIFGARTLGEHIGPNEVGGALAVSLGLAGLGWAAPSHSSHHTGGATFVVILAILTAIVAAPYVVGLRRHASALLVAASAGVAYAFAGLGTKFATDEMHRSAWLAALAWLVTLTAVSVIGQLNEMSALQQRPVTHVAPVVFGLNVLVPVALAPVLAHERWGHSSGIRIVLVGSLALVIVGMVRLARSKAVGAVYRKDAHLPGVGRPTRPQRAIPTGVPETSE